MLNLNWMVAALALGVPGSVLAHEGDMSLAKAAELGLHRVERLASPPLKKIDENFVGKFTSISSERVAHNAPTDPAFKVILAQVPGPDGKQSKVEVLLDDHGKALSYAVKPGTEATTAPRWPDKNPVVLAENSMHLILDNANNPKFKPYFTGFLSLELTQDRDAAGLTIGRAIVKSKETKAVLEILLKADGSVISSSVRE